MSVNETYPKTCSFLGSFEDVSIPDVPLLAGGLCCLNFSGTVIIVVAIFAISFAVISVFKMLGSALSVSWNIGCLAACVQLLNFISLYFPFCI